MSAIIQKIERFGGTWYGPLILFVIPISLVFAPLLIGNQVPAWGDDIIHHAAYLAFWSQSLQAGDSFLWNPLNFGGFPAFTTSFGYFAPWNYLIAWFIRDPFSMLAVLPWLTIIAFTLGAFFLFKLLRAFGLSFWSAYLGGVAFGVSHQTDALFMPVIWFHLFLPLLFFITYKMSQKFSWWYIAAGTLVVAFGWLAVNFQETIYILLGTAVFAAFLALRRWRADSRSSAKFLAGVALVYVLGTAIGLIQILPTREMAKLSTRAQGVSYAFAAEDAVLPTDFIRWVIPDVKLPQGIPFGSRGSTTPFYMGIVPLFFFLYAFAERQSLARFFRWLFVAATAIAIIYSPIFWLMTKLPLFSYFRVPDRWMVIGIFAVAVLVAFGAERFSRGAADSVSLRRFFRGFGVITGAVLALVIGLNAVFLLFEPRLMAWGKALFSRYLYLRYQPQGAVPVEHYFGIIDKYMGDLHRYFSLTEPIVLSSMIALVVSIVAIAWAIRQPNRFERGVLASLAAVAVFNWVLVKSFDYVSIPTWVHAVPPPTISFLQTHPGRALPVLYENFEEAVARPRYGLGGPDGVMYRFAMLVPNTNLFYGVESAIIKDGLEPMAISRLMGLVGAPVIGIPREFPHNDPEAASRTLVERKALLDFLGIRYLVSGYPLDESVFPKAFEGRVSSKQIPLAIYENREARPLVSFADRVEFVRSNDRDIFERYREANLSGLLADCASPCRPGVRSFGDGGAEIIERKNTRITVRTRSQEPTFLIFSQNYLPGWQAFLDGQEVRRYTVNTVFIGVEVPTGKHEVAFVYSNPCGSAPGFVTCLKFLLP